ncbi:unnamed protein product [Microthlaspi erraticum]|uniref:Uncharacterized protein n=1 Tax=Microthlaspi erraticum TaxID=1685480 RepID=A0A6D2I6N4_9BRAS|nr:unnamed protein product [Microthlaspi erraticum]
MKPMKLLFPKELIDESLEGFKEKVTRTLQLFPKAIVPRDIHGEIVYPADRKRKSVKNTIRVENIGRRRAKEILAGRSGKRTLSLGRISCSSANLADQTARTGRKPSAIDPNSLGQGK